MPNKNKKTSHRFNVLIAEDDRKLCAKLEKALRQIADCVSVRDGNEAIETYRKSLKEKRPFEFILLDVTMPERNGFDVLKIIRASEETLFKTRKPSHIIMITAFRDSLMELYNMGWDEFITKPVDTDKLIQKMKELARFDTPS